MSRAQRETSRPWPRPPKCRGHSWSTPPLRRRLAEARGQPWEALPPSRRRLGVAIGGRGSPMERSGVISSERGSGSASRRKREPGASSPRSGRTRFGIGLAEARRTPSSSVSFASVSELACLPPSRRRVDPRRGGLRLLASGRPNVGLVQLCTRRERAARAASPCRFAARRISQRVAAAQLIGASTLSKRARVQPTSRALLKPPPRPPTSRDAGPHATGRPRRRSSSRESTLRSLRTAGCVHGPVPGPAIASGEAGIGKIETSVKWPRA